MIIVWYNKNNHRKETSITSIEGIECYTDNALFGIRIRKDLVLFGGDLGTFQVKENRDAVCRDIKKALENNDSEFEFRKSFYER